MILWSYSPLIFIFMQYGNFFPYLFMQHLVPQPTVPTSDTAQQQLNNIYLLQLLKKFSYEFI